MSRRHPLEPHELEKKMMEVRSISEGFDLVADHLVITDPEGNIVYANPAALKQTGFSREEMMGKNPGDLWGGHMPPELYEEMWHTIKELKQAWHGEVRNKRKDGTEYWQELRVNPVLDGAGGIAYFVGIEPNVTERKAKEEQVSRNIAEIEALQKFFIGRELKMTELKKANDALKQELADYREGDLLDDPDD